MNYLKKLFGNNDVNSVSLEIQLKQLIRPATKIEITEAENPEGTSPLKSHFGGLPYFEEGETWPRSKSGRHMEFVFQVFNQPGMQLPKDIKLIQFYYDWEEFPWDTKSDGWLVKIYKELNYEKKLIILKPKIEREFTIHCEIEFSTFQSLPDWYGIDAHLADDSKLSFLANLDEPWIPYKKIVTRLISEPEYQSQLGGYPQWVQGDDTPTDKNGNPLKLLFQIYSEEDDDLDWGFEGGFYVFYDEIDDRIEFTFQCS